MKKCRIDFEQKGIRESYLLVRKIVKAGVLNKMEVCHLAALFADLKTYKANSYFLEEKFSGLLDYIGEVYDAPPELKGAKKKKR